MHNHTPHADSVGGRPNDALASTCNRRPADRVITRVPDQTGASVAAVAVGQYGTPLSHEEPQELNPRLWRTGVLLAEVRPRFFDETGTGGQQLYRSRLHRELSSGEARRQRDY